MLIFLLEYHNSWDSNNNNLKAESLTKTLNLNSVVLDLILIFKLMMTFFSGCFKIKDANDIASNTVQSCVINLMSMCMCILLVKIWFVMFKVCVSFAFTSFYYRKKSLLSRLSIDKDDLWLLNTNVHFTVSLASFFLYFQVKFIGNYAFLPTN